MVSLQEKNPAEGIENLNELASNEPEIRFLPTNVLLSLSTVPLLFGLWGGKSLSGFVGRTVGGV
ncbi:MAG: hypothetical protein HC925_07500 [Coleofasciculaceae cyanobacterium SM2_3_26]|nr:hypothetical protein [Coleofasciculaceae cyanobacterium SM2_3_26]